MKLRIKGAVEILNFAVMPVFILKEKAGKKRKVNGIKLRRKRDHVEQDNGWSFISFRRSTRHFWSPRENVYRTKKDTGQRCRAECAD